MTDTIELIQLLEDIKSELVGLKTELLLTRFGVEQIEQKIEQMEMREMQRQHQSEEEKGFDPYGPDAIVETF